MTDDRRPDLEELISLVEVPGPLPDGVEDALWESTAELYRQRISALEHESNKETIMLSPERNDTNRRRHTWLFAAAAALVAVLAIGLAVVPRSDEPEQPATTQVPPPTAPASPYRGIVWEDADDPARVNITEGRPELVDGPLRAWVDMFVMTPGPDESQSCADAVDEGATDPGGNPRVLPEVTSCLFVDWHFDVGDEAANNPGMDAREAVTADGEQVEPLVYDFPDATPGSSASGSVVYPNLGPGSRISLGYQVDLRDGGIIFERWEVVVPDAFQPIDWWEDGS